MSEYASMKIADLKKELKSKGLPVSGNKQELVERLQSAVDTALLDENDDDLDQEDEAMTEEAIKEAEAALQSQDTSFSEPEKEKNNSKSENKENSLTETASPEKATITSPKVSAEEKIKARAERFGGFQSDEAKKTARAERFSGMLPTKNGTAGKKIGEAPPADLELLKKRAERFGTAVSPLVKQAEVSEAIKRRQERFGIVSKDEPKPKKIALNSGMNSVLMDEAMLKRKERFGGTT